MEPTPPIRKAYPSDLRDGEWAILQPLVPAVKPGGRPARHRRRAIVNAILYVVRGGNQWRAMPHDLPPWQTAFYSFRIWRNDGTWERLHTALRERTRRHLGREATPSAAIRDSQSVKTSQRGGPRGDDAHQQVSGRKRHLLVDTQGFVLTVVVSAAAVQDRDGARLLTHALRLYGPDLPRLSLVWADAGYGGPLADELRQQMGWTLDVVKRSDAPPRSAFAVQPHRWIVERTFNWWGGLRRLSK